MDVDGARWEQPLDLAELGELTALWLEGAIWGPWYGDGPPDEETSALVPALAAMNRNGYVTDFSQPGEQDRGWSQRAAVTGYCAHPQADCLAGMSLESDLIVITEFPGSEVTYELPITQEDRRTHTRLAGRGVFDEPDHLWPGCHPGTWLLLANSHFVTVCDPRWGRDDLLWPSVVAALRASGERPGGLIRNC
ncbi:MAG: DUF6919 domain-containing protein [Solirubrobacteraceae bacterium]